MLHASLKKKIKKNEYKAQAEITEAQWSYGRVRKSERVRNLAKANQNRDCRIFEGYAFYMMELARNLEDTTIFNLGGTVYTFDSATVEFCLAVFCWAKFRKKGWIKIHTLYDVEAEVLAFFNITTASVHDSQR